MQIVVASGVEGEVATTIVAVMMATVVVDTEGAMTTEVVMMVDKGVVMMEVEAAMMEVINKEVVVGTTIVEAMEAGAMIAPDKEITVITSLTYESHHLVCMLNNLEAFLTQIKLAPYIMKVK